jgi:hypothetical protein
VPIVSYVSPGDVPDEVVRDLMEKAAQGNEAATEGILKELAEKGALRRLVPKLRRQEDLLDPVTARTLVRTVMWNGGLLPRERTMWGLDSTFTQSAILVDQLLLRIAMGAERDALAEQVIREAEPLPFAFECFRYIRKGKKDPESDRIVSDEAEKAVGRLLVERLKARAVKTPPWREFPQDTPGICWVWGQYGEPGDVTVYLEERFAASPEQVPVFLAAYVPTAWGMESGLPRKGDFERNAYDMVKELIDPEKIVAWLRQIYGPEVGQGDHYQPYTVPFEKRIAIQFGFIQRKVKEEAAVQATESNASVKTPATEDEDSDENA